jgi:hypothetical protein
MLDVILGVGSSETLTLQVKGANPHKVVFFWKAAGGVRHITGERGTTHKGEQILVLFRRLILHWVWVQVRLWVCKRKLFIRKESWPRRGYWKGKLACWTSYSGVWEKPREWADSPAVSLLQDTVSCVADYIVDGAKSDGAVADAMC